MKTKNISLKNVDSLRKYLTIFSGLFALTDAEIDVLAEMIRFQLRGMINGTPSSPFSSDAKKQIAARLGMKNPYSVNTYVQRFRAKGVIVDTPDGRSIHRWLMPIGEKQIVIEPEWNLSLD